MWRNLLVLGAFFSVVCAYGYYRDAMPNGRRIPCGNLCGGYCEGFGHVLNDNSDSCSGGGEHPYHYLSKFGKSWEKYGMEWSKEMCKDDSDGDGESNGDEMGDPCCVWTTGSTPSRVSQLSNPTRAVSISNVSSCALNAPTGVNIILDSTTQSRATMTWTTSSCMCGFNISRISPSPIPNIHTTLVSNPLSATAQVIVSGLEPDTEYSFSVRGYNLAGEAPVTINARTLAINPGSPAAPTGLATASPTSTSLPFSWSASSSATSYELDVGLESTGVYTTVYSGSALELQGLQPTTAYIARVKGVNSQGVGVSSSSISVTTPAYSGAAVSASYSSGDGIFTLGWSVTGNVITFEMTGQTLGYVAIGWGDNPTMLTTDMVVGSFDSAAGNGSVIDLWSTSRDTPAFDGKQDVTYVSGTQNTTHTTISFTRPLITNDTNQDIDIQDRQMYLVWALGSGIVSSRNNFGIHSKRGSAQVNFFTGNTEQVNTDRLKNAHGAISFFAWGMLLPIGSFIARYKRCDMGVWWFRAHVGIQLLGSVLTFIAFIIIASALGTSSPHFASTHAICGLLMLILTLGQNLIGLYSHLKYNPNRKRVPVFPDRVHGIIGLATLMFGFVTIFLGFDFYNVNLGAWLLGAQCLLFAVTGALVYEFFDGKED